MRGDAAGREGWCAGDGTPRQQRERRNAGIGEPVTMTTVTGEVLVRIRDHAYVTMP